MSSIRLSESDTYNVIVTDKEAYIDFQRKEIAVKAPIDILHEILHYIIRRIIKSRPNNLIIVPGDEVASRDEISEEALCRLISDNLEHIILLNMPDEISIAILKNGKVNPQLMIKPFIKGVNPMLTAMITGVLAMAPLEFSIVEALFGAINDSKTIFTHR
jgi:hypothetical protein